MAKSTVAIEADGTEVWIPGGVFLMGSDRHYPEEAPVHPVRVEGFWMDRTPVTNAQFRAFVEATGHITFAELPPRAEDYPGAPAELLRPGSLVFVKPLGPVDLRDIRNWWRYVPGADWRHPYGPGSGIEGLDGHPVVHVSYSDAEAYARWAGKALPSEAEWERAARGGLDGAEYAWGEEFSPGGRSMANTWQGRFPWENLLDDGYEGSSPVGVFPPNGYGLYDMIGNVWEWTVDAFLPRHAGGPVKACCGPSAGAGAARKVLKGGSHLCAPNYCRRYRPAARYPEPVDTTTCHVGFRCLRREPGGPRA